MDVMGKWEPLGSFEHNSYYILEKTAINFISPAPEMDIFKKCKFQSCHFNKWWGLSQVTSLLPLSRLSSERRNFRLWFFPGQNQHSIVSAVVKWTMASEQLPSFPPGIMPAIRTKTNLWTTTSHLAYGLIKPRKPALHWRCSSVESDVTVLSPTLVEFRAETIPDNIFLWLWCKMHLHFCCPSGTCSHLKAGCSLLSYRLKMLPKY